MLTLLPGARITIDPEALTPLASAAFSTIIEADVVVVADRTMTWDAATTAATPRPRPPRPSTTWYLAEGATHSGFSCSTCSRTRTPTPASVTVTYLLPAGRPS